MGRDRNGALKEIDPKYPAFPWSEVLQKEPLGETYDYLVSSIQSYIKAVDVKNEAELFVSGHDLRQALEIVIACKQSAVLGNQPIKLPLMDRPLTLLPSSYRWLGGNQTGNVQSVEEATGQKNSFIKVTITAL